MVPLLINDLNQNLWYTFILYFYEGHDYTLLNKLSFNNMW